MTKEQNRPEEFAMFQFGKNVYKVNLADYLEKCKEGKKVIRLPDGEIIDPDKIYLERYNKHGNTYKIPRLLSTNRANPRIYQMRVVDAELFLKWDGSCRTIHS